MPVAAGATNWGAVLGTLLVMVLGAFAALWAQGAPVNRGMRSALYVTIGFVGSLILLVGLMFWLAIPSANPWAPVVVSLAILLPLWRRFRQVVARIIPIDPASATHAVALIAVLLLILLQAALLLTAASRQEPISQETGLVEVLTQHLALVVLAGFGVGLWLRRDLATTLARLGLVRLTGTHAGLALLVALAGVLLTLALRLVAPAAPLPADRFADLFAAQMPNPLAAGAVALSTAIALELTFRGALQPRLGLPLTAVTYTLVGAQYPFSGALVALFLLALGLGIVRQRTSTTACIVTHATYNMVLVVLALATGAYH